MIKIYKNISTKLDELNIDCCQPGSWINLINPSIEEIVKISDIIKIPLDALKAALDVEERSRIEFEDNYILIIVHIPVRRGEDSYDTIPMGVILNSEYIVTVVLESNAVVSEFSNQCGTSFNIHRMTRFLFQLLYKTAKLYLIYLYQIRKRTDELEKNLQKSMKNRELFRLMELQEGLIYFMTSLKSNGVVLERISRLVHNGKEKNILHKKFIDADDNDEELLEDVIIENKQAIEMAEIYTNILTSMMDALASVISNNLNIVMKFLASITIIVAIPTLISSFWGMNVPVPFGHNPNGFMIIFFFALTICITTFIFFWKKDML